MKRIFRAAGLALTLSFGCAPVRTPVSASDGTAARDAYVRIRAAAYGPRRFKALFKGDISPKAGAVGRGYLAIWWDGESLFWKTSAPVAGEGRSGVLRLADAKGDVPLPGRLTPGDAIGILLGVPDLAPAGAPEFQADRIRIPLDATGRAAFVDGAGRVTGLELGAEAVVRFEPGEGVPRRIEASGRDGRATLALESYGPWPGDEAIPGGR